MGHCAVIQVARIMNKIFIVYDTDRGPDMGFIIGIFPTQYEAEKFEKRYKHDKMRYPEEYYTEIIAYDFPFNIGKK
jgi:hypothetical protein